MTSSNERMQQLHQSGTFLLVNVHDVGSAIAAEKAGAVALGTTSSGHAYSLGRPDGEGAMGLEEVAAQVAAMRAVVNLPISVDAENGWGHSPDQVAETIRVLAAAGANAASIEDWSGDPSMGFYDRSQALDRVVAAVEAAGALPEPFVIVARAEAFLFDVENPLREALARLQSFAGVGADCLYAPGPSDKETLATIAREAGGPTNALIQVGSPMTMRDAEEIGIRRVSIGGSLYGSMMKHFDAMVRQMTTTGEFGTP